MSEAKVKFFDSTITYRYPAVSKYDEPYECLVSLIILDSKRHRTIPTPGAVISVTPITAYPRPGFSRTFLSYDGRTVVERILAMPPAKLAAAVMGDRDAYDALPAEELMAKLHGVVEASLTFDEITCQQAIIAYREFSAAINDLGEITPVQAEDKLCVLALWRARLNTITAFGEWPSEWFVRSHWQRYSPMCMHLAHKAFVPMLNYLRGEGTLSVTPGEIDASTIESRVTEEPDSDKIEAGPIIAEKSHMNEDD